MFNKREVFINSSHNHCPPPCPWPPGPALATIARAAAGHELTSDDSMNTVPVTLQFAAPGPLQFTRGASPALFGGATKLRAVALATLVLVATSVCSDGQ